jgi:hypothetical protein
LYPFFLITSSLSSDPKFYTNSGLDFRGQVIYKLWIRFQGAGQIKVFPAIFLIIEIIYLSVESTFTITSNNLQNPDSLDFVDNAV